MYQREETIGNGYFPAINVTKIQLLLGNQGAANQQVERGLEILDQVDYSGDPFWPHATRGEAILLIGRDPAEALDCYWDQHVHCPRFQRVDCARWGAFL